MILIQKMHSSGIMRYNDIINDMDFFSKFKYTIKGPHSLGNKNSNSISARYRGLHHSYIGHIDLTVCGNSDPGTSGVLSPWGKMDGLYFDGSPEPDNFRFEFQKAVLAVAEKEGVEKVILNFSDKDDYYAAMNEMRNFVDERVKITSTSRADDTTIVIEEKVNLDEKNQ